MTIAQLVDGAGRILWNAPRQIAKTWPMLPPGDKQAILKRVGLGDMKIEFGPPGVAGVKHLQYLSGDAPDYVSAGVDLKQVAKLAGIAALVWFFFLRKHG